MGWLSAWRRDLARPELPTDRREIWFLSIGAAVIIVAAQISDPAPLPGLLVVIPAALAFVVRGMWSRMPSELFAVAVIAPVMIAVGLDGDLELSIFLIVVMVLYAAWHLASLTRAVVIAVVAGVAPVVVATIIAPESGIGWVPWASACGFTFVLGRALQQQQQLIDELELARHALAVTAVAEERRRIARELHDLAGHTLSAMLLHVTGARHVLRRDLDEAERALLDAEAVGRSSLDQIRGTVVALRTDEQGTDPPLSSGADVAALIEEYRRAGLRVDARIPGDLASVNAATGVGLHRIVREALANVARHAPGNTVEVAVEIAPGSLHLRVRDRGRAPRPGSVHAAHFGLVDMAERARALGGVVHAGPTDDGWLVEATLPTQVDSHSGATP